MNEEFRELPRLSMATSPWERFAALMATADMSTEEELRFLWAHPELEPRGRRFRD